MAGVAARFVEEAVNAFRFLADDYGLAGPLRDTRLTGPAVCYFGQTIDYTVLLDPRELDVVTLIRAPHARPPAHAPLDDLVVALGRPLQTVRSNAHTLHNLRQALASQVKIIAELHPRLSGPEGTSLLRNAMT